MNKENNKEINNLSIIFKRFQTLFEDYVNKPSDPILAELLNLGKIYKEVWIEEASSNPENLLKYKDLISNIRDELDFEDIISEIPVVREKYLEDETAWGKLDNNNPEIGGLEESEGYLEYKDLNKSIGIGSDDDTPQDAFKKTYTAKFEDNTNAINGMSVTKRANKNKTKSSSNDSTLKLILSKEVSRQESPDKKTKIVTQSLFSNKAAIGDAGSLNFEINSYQHAMRAVREHEERFFNRRWYVEKLNDGETQEPWWVSRDQHDQMIELANKKGFFRSTLNDQRILDKDTKIIFSNDLSKAEYQKYLREISFPYEREKISQNSYFFVVFEARYNKTMKQIIDSMVNNDASQHYTWRDACIFSPNEITYRAITNDQLAKPSISIEDAPDWAISNDMSRLSNQAMRAFIAYTHPGMEINELDE